MVRLCLGLQLSLELWLGLENEGLSGRFRPAVVVTPGLIFGPRDTA